MRKKRGLCLSGLSCNSAVPKRYLRDWECSALFPEWWNAQPLVAPARQNRLLPRDYLLEYHPCYLDFRSVAWVFAQRLAIWYLKFGAQPPNVL